MQIALGTFTYTEEEVQALLAKPEPDEKEHCQECGSTEAGSCFYCKMD